MLVGAFEIEVGRPFEVGIALEGEDVRAARVEPDIEDVRHLLEILGLVLVAEEALGRAFEPHVGAFGAEGVDDAAHHLGIAQAARRSALLTNTAIGTPQARWRDTHQSGRCSIMLRSRL